MSDSAKVLLDVRNLTVFYGKALALGNVSLQVNEGEIVSIVGANGAGKTTAIRTISGSKQPSSGEIWFDGKRIDGQPPQRIIRLGIRHVLEGRGLFPYMSVLENLKVGAFLQTDRAQIDKNLKNIFEHFPRLQERQRQAARTLSGGEQQMLTIARALMGSPRLLLLDEPSLGLSPMMVREIGKIVRDIHDQGVTVLLVEQNARLALGLAERCYVLETGSIVVSGATSDLVNSDLVKKAYLGL